MRMGTIDFGDEADVLARVDGALERGDFLQAKVLCLNVLNDSIELRDNVKPLELLLHGVTSYRLAVAEYFSGDLDGSLSDFQRARNLVSQAIELEGDAKASDEMQQSLNSGEALRDGLLRPVRESSYYDPTIVMLASCEHGCKVSVQPCGYRYQHC